MMLLETKARLRALPIFHINSYRLLAFVDYNNQFGKGPNAIFSMNGLDKSTALLISPSIEALFEKHYEYLKNDSYYIHDDELTIWKNDPLIFGGSKAESHGIIVEA
jgi:hypothetical protein